MRLEKLMHVSVFSVSPQDSLDKAICLMDEHRIHHLPVVDGGHVVGMISDRDLLLSVGWKLECERKPDVDSGFVGASCVGHIMSRPVLYLSPENERHTAANLMAGGKFHALPLVSGRRLMGIVTSTDLLKAACHPGPGEPVAPVLLEEVGRHMLTNVRTISPSETLHQAAKIMFECRIRHLPVTTGATLLGVVSDRDIRRAFGNEMIEDEIAQSRGEFYLGSASVASVMSRAPWTVREDSTTLEAMRIMVDHRIGSIMVTRGIDQLVGLMTDTDMLRLIAMAGDQG